MGEPPLLLFFAVHIQENKSESGCTGRKPSFCASFDGKCLEAVVLVEGPHFEQLSMENVRNRFFFEKKSRKFGGAPGGAPGELRGAPGSSGELRGAPGSSGELRGTPGKTPKKCGEFTFFGGNGGRIFLTQKSIWPQICSKFCNLVSKSDLTLHLLKFLRGWFQELVLP